MTDINVADILKGAYEDKTSSVEDAFNSVIQRKMADAIQARREEIASSMMSSEESESEEDTENEDV